MPCRVTFFVSLRSRILTNVKLALLRRTKIGDFVDTTEAVGFAEKILQSRYQGAWAVSIPNTAWWFRHDGMTTALTITDDNGGMLRVTSGVAQDVPMSDLAYRTISERNNDLYYGRVYAERNDEIGVLAVLLQEIIPLALLSWEYRASIEYALSVIASVNLTGAQAASHIIPILGGRLWVDGDVLPLFG